jgi:hypothetical protein
MPLTFEDGVAASQTSIVAWEPSEHGPRHGTVWLCGKLGHFGFAVYYDPDNGGFHLGGTIEYRSKPNQQAVARAILEELFAQFPQARVPRARR